ncbi:hypothetical protein ACWFRF_05075 [Nocardia sp. NPDC055165]|uniref:hypothetical protein n=1 Tax=Nocardia sp. NPDC060220 TaxID=3347076 RepID=UPI0036525AAE
MVGGPQRSQQRLERHEVRGRRLDPGDEVGRVLTVSDFAAAAELGARVTHIEMRYDLLDEFARLAGEGVLAVSVARTYTLDQIHETAKLSQSRRSGGKLTLVL